MNYELVIFDFDGTIADSQDLMIFAYKQIAINRNIETLDDDKILELRKLSAKEIIKILGVKLWQIPSFIREARFIYSENINLIKPIDEINKLVREIRPLTKIAIVSTNSASTIKSYLKKIDLDIFDDIIEAGLFNKSNSINKLIKKYKINKTKAIYIGDEVRDIESSKKSGISCISVAWGMNTIEFLEQNTNFKVAKKPQDLLDYLK
jgi:phosphoglycolate phosphatase-like HAD superfamily hydrolase